jgi:hypothetical protein
MNINRTNYEDFFLLYADGELRADECKQVEAFLAQNEDLRIELDMLQAAILPIEELVFIDKSFLYKETVFDATKQEQLLYKIDNELPKKDELALDKLISNDNKILAEYELLQRTKLDTTEKIIFEEKYLLYKNTKDNVVAFRWVRWAAAAALIGFSLLVGIQFYNSNDKPNTSVAVEKPKAKIQNTMPENSVVKESTDKNYKAENITVVDKVPLKVEDAIVNNMSTKKQKTIAPVKNKKETNYKGSITTANDDTNVLKSIANKHNNDNNTSNVLPNNNPFVRNDTELSIAKIENTINQNASIAAPTLKILENKAATMVALVEKEQSEDKILYMNEEQVSKTKLGGFIKRIKRVVERTANVSTSKSILIAGFEIAAK